MAWHGMYMMQQSQQTASMPKVYYTADCVAVGPPGHLSYRWNKGRIHRRRESVDLMADRGTGYCVIGIGSSL